MSKDVEQKVASTTGGVGEGGVGVGGNKEGWQGVGVDRVLRRKLERGKVYVEQERGTRLG